MTHPAKKFNYSFIQENDMPDTVDGEIRNLLCMCFPQDVTVYSYTRYWHGSAPAYSIICRAADRICIIGYIGVVIRQIACGQKQFTVAGIQNLVVHPRFQRKGIGTVLVKKAQFEALNRGISYGMLFCTQNLVKFYESMGWCVLKFPVMMENGSGEVLPVSDNDIPMVNVFTGISFPEGEVDLQGPDW
jgi:GNAT superfamily N-acetyltransferase